MARVIHVLTGCTAVGKTELALRWAEANNAEIVSCDSLLFYRGMDLGTAKPTRAELARVPHHLIDVRGVTDIADAMVIASGNSDRHVRAIAGRVREFAKQAGYRPLGVEGDRDGEWVLVDLTDVIVHVMLPRVREFYRLEDLWDVTAARREAAER